MLQFDEPNEFVIATGETHSERKFCDVAFAAAHLPLTWEDFGTIKIDRRAIKHPIGEKVCMFSS